MLNDPPNRPSLRRQRGSEIKTVNSAVNTAHTACVARALTHTPTPTNTNNEPKQSAHKKRRVVNSGISGRIDIYVRTQVQGFLEGRVCLREPAIKCDLFGDAMLDVCTFASARIFDTAHPRVAVNFRMFSVFQLTICLTRKNMLYLFLMPVRKEVLIMLVAYTCFM